MLPHATCTVVIPCYDGEPYLEAAVRSVWAQSFPDYHLVLVDDASRDGTRALARRLAAESPRPTLVELPENRGRCFTRNRGAEVTRGPYLAFLDQDDTYHPDFLQAAVRHLSRSPALDAVKMQPNITVDIDPVRYKAVANSLATTMLLRRTAFEFVGGWPEGAAFRRHLGGCEDVAFQQLFSSCFNIGVTEQKLYNYTRRPGNGLDQFLARSGVVEGRVVFHDAWEDDSWVAAEVQHLRRLLRERIRHFIVERLGAGETYLPPGARPAGFARLEGESDGRA
jgi:glycosyltransferase involved in cell wall biosynthesis